MTNYLMKKNPFFSPRLSLFGEDEELPLSNWPLWTDQTSNLNIYEDENAISVEAALPGISHEDINVIFEKGVLQISGDHRETEEDKNKKYYKKAMRSYNYRIVVPGEIDENREPEAHYKDGIMTIRFAKSKKSQPKKINVQKG